MIELDNEPNNHGDHLGSAYQDGWYGYAKKDLRDDAQAAGARQVLAQVLRQRQAGALPRGARGVTEGRARQLARRTKVYGDDQKCVDESGGDGNKLQYCYDTVVHRPLGAIEQPRIHWINRPTFQQAVEIQGRGR